MPLIKSAQAPASATPFSMSDIEAHARSILLRATQQAEQLLAAAQAEAEAMKKRAALDGKAQGLAEGKREGVAQGLVEGEKAGRQAAFDAEKAKCEAAFNALVEIGTAFDAERHRITQAAEQDVLPLALAIGRKVTRRMGEVHPAVVQANLNDCLRLIGGTHDVRIAVNAGQLALVEEMLPRIRQQWPALTHLTIVADETVAAGGCRVQTNGGDINADLNDQLDRLIEELVGVAGD